MTDTHSSWPTTHPLPVTPRPPDGSSPNPRPVSGLREGHAHLAAESETHELQDTRGCPGQGSHLHRKGSTRYRVPGPESTEHS